MEISIEYHGDQFNVLLATKAGQEPFLTVKGARIVNGQNGVFVSWPATKNQNTGKFWQHVWASDKFNAVVLSKAQEAQPPKQRAGAGGGGGGDDMGDVPFADPYKGVRALVS